MFGSIGMPELIIILVVVLIFFGLGKLPELGSTIGKAIRGFKKAVEESDEKSGELSETKSLSVNNLHFSAWHIILFPGGGYGEVPLMGSIRRVLEACGAVHSQTGAGGGKAVPEKARGRSQTDVGAASV